MRNDLDTEEMLQLERLCLEQAEECATAEGRAALRILAANYRAVVVEHAARAVERG